MTEIQMTQTPLKPFYSIKAAKLRIACLENSNIRISNLFRVSIFGFRVYSLHEYAGNGRTFSILTGRTGGFIMIEGMIHGDRHAKRF